LPDVFQNNFHVLTLFRVQFSGQSVQQNGHKLPNRGQGGTEFVRHLREEIVFEFYLLCLDKIGFRLQAVAINGMAKSPGKRTTFDLTFDQVVLCAVGHGFGGQRFVIQAR